MFENVLIIIALTIAGAALLQLGSSPIWNGGCYTEICNIQMIGV